MCEMCVIFLLGTKSWHHNDLCFMVKSLTPCVYLEEYLVENYFQSLNVRFLKKVLICIEKAVLLLWYEDTVQMI